MIARGTKRRATRRTGIKGFLCGSLLLIAHYAAGAQNSPISLHQSLAIRCADTFLSVSARTPDRNTVPDVRLGLANFFGQKKGYSADRNDIPNSYYGEVIQIPNQPEHSKALAIEICDAKLGVYQVQVKEQASIRYVLDVTARENAGDSEVLLLHHIGKRGRTLRYKFVFRLEGKDLILRWIDKNGTERMEIEPNDW